MFYRVNAVNSQANTWPVQNMLLQPISALGIHAMSNHNAGNAAEAIGVQAIVNKETSADFVSLDAAQSMNAQLESAQAIVSWFDVFGIVVSNSQIARNARSGFSAAIIVVFLVFLNEILM